MWSWFTRLDYRLQAIGMVVLAATFFLAFRAWVLWLVRKTPSEREPGSPYRRHDAPPAPPPTPRTAPYFTLNFSKEFGRWLGLVALIVMLGLGIWRFARWASGWGECTDTAGIETRGTRVTCHPQADLRTTSQGSGDDARIHWGCYCRAPSGASRVPRE
jgi:hypothetical protein